MVARTLDSCNIGLARYGGCNLERTGRVIVFATLCAMLLCGAVISLSHAAHQVLALLSGLCAVIASVHSLSRSCFASVQRR